jgi:hypothetical protein
MLFFTLQSSCHADRERQTKNIETLPPCPAVYSFSSFDNPPWPDKASYVIAQTLSLRVFTSRYYGGLCDSVVNKTGKMSRYMIGLSLKTIYNPNLIAPNG